MEPIVRPLMTVAEKKGKTFVAAEIPGIDIADRPCYYRGQGRVRGSYIRVGDSDEPMTEYEIYSYEAFRRKYQDDVREIQNTDITALDYKMLSKYIALLKEGKPNLSNMDDTEIMELMSIIRKGAVTLNACILFGRYPQVYYPQLCIIAIAVPGREIGEVDSNGARFIDNCRIEGNISQMLNGALQFVRKNMKKMTVINHKTGQREERTEYPITVVREAVVNALVHRDYSIHTERMPIQIQMYEDRMEIHNPGGIYGRIRIDQLGKVQPDTRNPVLTAAVEVIGITENRYSGIPTIRREMHGYGLGEPEFSDKRGNFCVCFYKAGRDISYTESDVFGEEAKLISFCKIPRSRKEICAYLGLSSITYAMQAHVQPLIDAGLIKMSLPDKPKSSKQRYFS